MARTALITGVTGQDGAYLARLLLAKGYRVIGAVRRNSVGQPHRLNELGIGGRVEIRYLDLADLPNAQRLVQEIQPDEIYNLAAQSFVGTSWDMPMHTSDINAIGALRLLESIRSFSPHTAFYQASTSEMFGKVGAGMQDEETPFHPRSPYGFAKAFAHHATVNYRESFGLRACSGILFNHESPLRGSEFVTRKITLGLARIRNGQQSSITLGNLSAGRDWGYAPDYVEGMWRMLQQERMRDYVLATGSTRTVRQFAEIAASASGYDIAWEGRGADETGIDRKSGAVLIRVDAGLYRPAEVEILCGNAVLARAELGWRTTATFEEMVEEMVRRDFDRIALGQTWL